MCNYQPFYKSLVSKALIFFSMLTLVNSCFCSPDTPKGLKPQSKKKNISSPLQPTPGTITLTASPSTLKGEQTDFILNLQHQGELPTPLSNYALQLYITEIGATGSQLSYTDADKNPITAITVNKKISHYFSNTELTNKNSLTMPCRFIPAKKVKKIIFSATLSNGADVSTAQIVWEITPSMLIDDELLVIVEDAKNIIDTTLPKQNLQKEKQIAAEKLLIFLNKLKNKEDLTTLEQQQAACAAASVGNTAVLEVLLKNITSFDVNQQDAKGSTPLHHVTNRETAQFLLDRGADIDLQDQEYINPFQRAIDKGLVETVTYMASRNADVDNTRTMGMKSLSLHIAMGNQGIRDQEKILKLLIQGGIDINRKSIEGITPLQEAAWHANIAGIKLLLAIPNIQVNVQDNKGNTALHEAVRSGNKEIVELLLKQPDIEVNTKNQFGFTLLGEAVESGNKEIVKLLLNTKDIQVNTKDKWGSTPLHKAVESGNKEIVKLLLDTKSVFTNIQNGLSKTALQIAKDKNNQEIIDLLENS